MARLSILLFLIQTALAVTALISCLSTEEDEIKSLPRVGWILIILFFPLVGALAWFIAGRTSKRPGIGWGQAGAGGAGGRRSRPLAPDDDPEFLRSLDPQRKRDEQPDDDQSS